MKFQDWWDIDAAHYGTLEQAAKAAWEAATIAASSRQMQIDASRPAWVAVETPGAEFDITFCASEEEAWQLELQSPVLTKLYTEGQMRAYGEAVREACAKVCEAMDTDGYSGFIETQGDLCDALAAAIRALGEP